MVVSNICYFHPYLGKWSNLINIFQMGWNHQLNILEGFSEFNSMINRQIRSGNQAGRDTVKEFKTISQSGHQPGQRISHLTSFRPESLWRTVFFLFQALTRFSSCEGLPQGCSRFPYCLDLYRLIGCFTNLLLWRLKVGINFLGSIFSPPFFF